MEIYALQGVSNTGKSTTLKLLFLEILEKYFDKIEEVREKSVGICDKKQVLDKIKAQIFKESKFEENSYVENINYSVKINGKIITVASAGDSEKEVSEAVAWFEKTGCDIGFCAVRTKGNGVELLTQKGAAFIKKAHLTNATDWSKFKETAYSLDIWQAKNGLLPLATQLI